MRIFFLFFVVISGAFADQYLIDEMEALRSSLDKNDHGRQELTLRLADLYFDVSIQEGDEVESETRFQQRKKALALYLAALEGHDSVEKVQGQKRILIKYQVARVYRKLNKMDLAKNYFKEVFESETPDNNLKREAAYSLAEYYEEKINFERADNYYLEAIKLCETKESCNLSHYKRAWLHYKEIKIDSAIEELKLALFDRKGQVREKIINDLMLFFSNRTTDGSDEVSYIQDLVNKTGKHDLVRQLVESFYSAGNRVAGATALIYLNQKSPDIFYEMRLLEESYGFSDWDEIEKYLSALEIRRDDELPPKAEEAKEFKEMLKRVIVQFGSEAQEDPKQYASYLRRVIDRYLGFYPNDDMRTKLQQGWLKAQPDKVQKVQRLGIWIREDIEFGKETSHIRKLRQTRLSLAQELKLKNIILEEALELAALLKGTPEAREFNYVAGLHYYQNNNFNFALAKFVPLAKIDSIKKADKWAILAQNLTLDIYNQRKKYDLLAEQADSWLTLDVANADKETKSELESMQQIRTQSQFEYYANKGEDQDSLEHFYKNCFAGIFEKKSCENAKVLAIKLKDQLKLVALLEKAKDEKSLMVEYERMGRFSEAAKLQEKFELNKSSGLEVYLKIAALYEIDQNFEQRNRILKKALKTFKSPLDTQMENAFFATLDQANLIDEKSIILPWSIDRKISLANRFRESKSAIKVVSSQKTFAGALWMDLAFQNIDKDYEKFKNYRFYGRNSERRFKYKVKLLERLVATAKKYLEASPSEGRAYILEYLKQAYLSLGTEIMSTPIPDGLTDDIMMQVQANLTQLATPYLTVADDYRKLQTSELESLDQDKSALVSGRLESFEMGELTSFKGLIKSEPIKVVHTDSFNYSELGDIKEVMAKDPYNRSALERYQSFYQKMGNKRLASYFKGRLNQLGENI
ncbi:MAG: hypothetical protein CME65_06445 [Halobacteriovoraceae bacterium]|nr:hypothetical protein [Halobacteriovoraceae bacterium]